MARDVKALLPYGTLGYTDAYDSKESLTTTTDAQGQCYNQVDTPFTGDEVTSSTLQSRGEPAQRRLFHAFESDAPNQYLYMSGRRLDWKWR